MITAHRRAKGRAPTPAVEAVRTEAPKASPVSRDATAPSMAERPAKSSGPKPRH